MIAKSGADGISLDYMRFFGNNSGYSDIIVNAFKEKFGKDPFKLSCDDPEWVKFRADYVTQCVAQLRQSLDAIDENLEIWACVGPDPQECLNNNLQDWGNWLDMGLIDGVLTMIYERDTNNTLKNVMITTEAIKSRVPHIPMLTAWQGNLETPAMLREGFLKALKGGASGVAHYRDETIHQLELWPVVKEVAHWTRDYVRSQQVNYVLNSSFENDFENWAVGDGKGIDLSSDKVRTGKKCLRGQSPEGMQIYQIIDRGFFKDRSALNISAWINTEKVPTDGSLAFEITANYNDGQEDCYHIPATTTKTEGWQKVEGVVSIRNVDDLKFVIVGIKAKASPGKLYIDDIALNLSDDKVDPGRFRIQAATPIDTKGRVNIVLGQLVKGSSFWQNGREYDNAVDGNISCDNLGKGASWHSQRPPFDQWIKIYLPQIHKISKIRMLNSSADRGYRTKDYKIEVSTNDLDYQQVASGTLPNDGQAWTEVEIKPASAKYIKFTGITGYSSTHAVGLKEIEVY